MRPIKLSVEILPPHDGSRWTAKVEVLNTPRYYAGAASGDSVAEAFNDAVLLALATGFEPEEDHVS